MWLLKANVKHYVELSSAIRVDYCHRLDSKKDPVKRKDSKEMMGEHDGEHTKGPPDSKIVKEWRAKDIFDI